MIQVSLTPRNGSGAQRGTIEFHGAFVLDSDGSMRILDYHPGKKHSEFTILNPPGFVSLEIIEAIFRRVTRGEIRGTTDDYEWVATIS